MQVGRRLYGFFVSRHHPDDPQKYSLGQKVLNDCEKFQALLTNSGGGGSFEALIVHA